MWFDFETTDSESEVQSCPADHGDQACSTTQPAGVGGAQCNNSQYCSGNRECGQGCACNVELGLTSAFSTVGTCGSPKRKRDIDGGAGFETMCFCNKNVVSEDCCHDEHLF